MHVIDQYSQRGMFGFVLVIWPNPKSNFTKLPIGIHIYIYTTWSNLFIKFRNNILCYTAGYMQYKSLQFTCTVLEILEQL